VPWLPGCRTEWVRFHEPGVSPSRRRGGSGWTRRRVKGLGKLHAPPMVPSAGTRKRAEDPDLRFSAMMIWGCVSDTERRLLARRMSAPPPPSVTASREVVGSDCGRHGEHPGASMNVAGMPIGPHASKRRSP